MVYSQTGADKIRKVSVSMTARQYDRVSILCCKTGESKQDYIKRLINEDAKQRGELLIFYDTKAK